MSTISSCKEELKQKQKELKKLQKKMSKYKPTPKDRKYLFQSTAKEFTQLEIAENELKLDISIIKREIKQLKDAVNERNK